MKVAKIVTSEQVTEKRCGKCHEVKPLSEFSDRKSRKGKKQSYCKSCCNDLSTAYRKRPLPLYIENLPATKICNICKEEKPYSEFYANCYSPDRHLTRCKPCHRAINNTSYHRSNAAYKHYANRSHLIKMLKKFSITLEEYEQVLDRQNGVCAICGKPETDRNMQGIKSLALDHDHNTGKFRGLLCGNCNRGLGNFQDDPKLLAEAIAYLTEKSLVCRQFDDQRILDL